MNINTSAFQLVGTANNSTE